MRTVVKCKRMCSLFIALTMIMTMFDAGIVSFAKDSEESFMQAYEAGEAQESQSIEFFEQTAESVEVSSAEELENALEEGEGEICIVSDFVVDRTFYIANDTNIYSEKKVTLTRDPAFAGDIFVIGENSAGEAASERVCLSLGNPKSLENNLLIIDGNSENLTVSVLGSVLFVCKNGQADLYANLTITNNKKVGNERSLLEQHGMTGSKPNTIGGAAGIVSSGSIMNIFGGIYSNNRVNTSSNSIYGGAFYNYGQTSVYGGTFENNSAYRAAFCYNYRTLYVYNAIIKDNIASSAGGAIYSPASTAAFLYLGGDNEYVESSVLFKNNTSEHGGAIYSAGRLFAQDTVFEANSAKASGGAIYATGNYNIMELTNVQFKDNSAAEGGGAVFSKNKTTYTSVLKGLKIKNVSFSGNTSSANGGALYISEGVQALLEKAKFENNEAKTNGGAIYNIGADLEADNVTFSKNSATSGGAIAFITPEAETETTTATLNNVTASGNAAASNGGAVYVTGSTFNIYNSKIDNNTAKAGSGFYLSTNATGNIYKTIFSQNACNEDNTGNSATLFIYTGGTEVTVHSCTFTENTTAGLGGAMTISGKSIAKLYNITAIDNTALKGGVLYITSAGTEVTLSGMTVSGNTASGGGPVIWGNTANAKLYINKANHKDLDVSGAIDSAYWKTAIANKLTVTEVGEEVPGYTDYSNEDMSTLWDSYDVRTLEELEEALKEDYKHIRIVSDITVNKTIYITRNVTLFTTDEFKIVRADSFTGNMFVVGETSDGTAIEGRAKLTLGNPSSKTEGLLTIDGKAINAAGSAVFVSANGQADLYDNVIITNCKTNGKNPLNAGLEDYGNIGGAALMVRGGATVNVYGAQISLCGSELALKGGAIYNMGALNLSGTVLSENKAAFGGAVYNVSAMNLDKVNFIKNAAESGGAVFNKGALTVKDAHIEENSAVFGGAILTECGTLDIDNTVFSKNSATEDGGAVNIRGGMFSANGAEFAENNAKAGGGLYAQGEGDASITITTSRFDKNSANTGAGAYIAVDGADISATSFNNNASTADGAGLYIKDAGNIILSRLIANGNISKANGGFIYANGAGFEVSESEIAENEAENGGAIALEEAKSIKFLNNVILENVANSEGGAIYASNNKDIMINGGTFSKNNATNGGAVFVNATVLEVSGTIFSENIADLDGGVFALSDCDNVVMLSVTATENIADLDGGFISSDNSDIKIYNSTIQRNEAGLDGGVFKFDEGTKSGIYGTELSGNIAGRNGGVILASGVDTETTMHNCVFTENEALRYGGIGYLNGKAKCNIYASNLKENSASRGKGFYVTDADTTLTLNGITVEGGTNALVWGANDKAVLKINKENYTDVKKTSLDDAYWKTAIANKIKVNEIKEAIPEYFEYGNESSGNLTPSVSVSSSEELENAINSGAKYIRIIEDFYIDRTFYISSNVTIFSTAPRVLTRAPGFGGDIFVVGEHQDGSSAMMEDDDAKLVLGNPSSETLNLLTIDGNKDNMEVSVSGTVVFVENGAKAEFYKNLTVINCHKTANERTENEKYSFSRGNRVGGSIGIISSGVLDVFGGTYKNNSVKEEDSSTEEGRNSTIGGVFYNKSNIRIYDGLFENNTGARGGIVYNYGGMKIMGGSFIGNRATVIGGVYYSPNSASSYLIVGSDNNNGRPVLFKDNTAAQTAGVIYSSTLNGLVIYENTTFEGNKAENGNGGAICVYGMLTAKGVEFKDNFAAEAGGAIFLSNSTESYETRFVNITDCVFESNNASMGGAITLNAASEDYAEGGIATVSGSEFINNSATPNEKFSSSAGGAVYSTRKSSLKINDSTFESNASEGEGGVMYLVGESVTTITDSVLTGNTASGHGGAISIRSSKLDLNNTIIEDNTSSKNGGAMYVAYSSSRDVNSDITIVDSALTGNYGTHGGAIYATRRDIPEHIDILSITNTDFSRNTAKGSGGAVLTTGGSGAYMKDVVFVNNSVTASDGTGGALEILGGSIEIDGGVFTKNATKNNGGAIDLVSGATAVLNNISASRNDSKTKGGFLYSEGASFKLYNSTLRGNTADFGGAVYLYEGAASEIYNTEFKDNKAVSDNGGAMFVYTGSEVKTLLNGASFAENHAANSGGALYISGESDISMYNVTAKENEASYGGFMYITKAGTKVLVNSLTVSGNSAVTGGPIIWGNTKNAALSINKTKYTDLDADVFAEGYWSGAIANLLTVTEIEEETPEEDVYEGDIWQEEEAEELEPVSVEDVFSLAENSSDAVINSTYGKLPRLDNSSNFMSKQQTTFDDINGQTVTVDTFVYQNRHTEGHMNVGLGLMLFQALEYKKAFPDEDVSIEVASYRFSVDAAVNINRNSRYFGYQRNISTGNYDQYGFVTLGYLLVTAAKMGINVTVVGQHEGYPVSSKETLYSYFSDRLDWPCDPDYVKDGKVGDYMNFAYCYWTIGAEGKGGTDMMHTKMGTVSHYLDMNGNVHRNAVFSTSANFDGVSSSGASGNWKVQTATIISDHEQLYKVCSNYIKLVADYCYQEGIIEIQDIVNTRSTQQIDMIMEGRGEEIPEDERIVYIGTEKDDVFEMYFTPFGGGRLSWSERYNPYCKYVRELYNSEDYILFTFNVAESARYSLYNQIEKMVIDAFHNNKNPKNKIYVNMEAFDSTAFDDLEVGTDIGFKSFNQYHFKEIHNKDMQVSYVKDGQRYYTSLLNSLNQHSGSMYYQSNFCLVVKEKTCSENSVFSTIAKYTTVGDIVTHTYGEEKYDEGSATEHANMYVECVDCGARKVTTLIHRAGDWITDKEATEDENGICHKECVLCGELMETMEVAENIHKDIQTHNVTGKQFTNDPESNIHITTKNTPQTFEATILVPRNVKDRAGVIVGNYGTKGDVVSFEVHQKGKPRLYYVIDGKIFDYKFTTDIRSNDPVHMAIVVDGLEALLYVNGEFKEKKDIAEPLPESVVDYKVGGDFRKGNAQYFKGTIYSVNLFNDVRNPEEIKEDTVMVPSNTQGLLYSGYYTDEEAIVKLGAEEIGMTFNKNDVHTFDKAFSKSPRTIEAVIHVPKEYTNRAGVLLSNYGADDSNALSFEVYNDGLLRLFYLDNGTRADVRFTTDVRSEEPIHLAVTIAEKTALVYINGELVETKALPRVLPELTDNFAIGGDVRANNDQFFKGTIYSMNIFSDARSAEEIKQDMIAADKTDEEWLYSLVMTGDKVVSDVTGQSFDVRLMGYVNCKVDSTPHTFEATVQLDKEHTKRGGIIIGNNGGDKEQINFEIYTDGRPRFYYVTNGVTTDCVFDTDVRSDKPVHIAVTMDGNIATLYVNGEQTEIRELEHTLGDSCDNFVIGGDLRTGNDQYFKGKIYGVQIFSDVRNADEIKKDMLVVRKDEENVLYSGYFITGEQNVIEPEDMHSNRIVVVDREATDTENGYEHIECADCGKILSAIEKPSDSTGFNHIDLISAVGIGNGKYHSVEEAFLSSPKTVEMLINLPLSNSERAGVLFGTYDGSAKNQISFEIYTNGQPRLWYKVGGTGYSNVFTTDVRSDEKTHIAFTIDGLVASLYINGEFKESVTLARDCPEILEGYLIGNDYRADKSQIFKGTIYGINVFSDVRTAEEIKLDTIGVARNSKDLIYSKFFAE